jgi:hypothetical protein
MPQRETALVGRNNVRAQITGQEELLVKVNSIDPQAVITANIKSPLGQQTINDSVSVTLASEQANIQVVPMLMESFGATGNLTSYSSNSLLSISFASRGTTGSDVSVDGGLTYVRLFQGETLNLDASGIMNYYDPTLIYWNTTVGIDSKLLIAFNYI